MTGLLINAERSYLRFPTRPTTAIAGESGAGTPQQAFPST